MSLAAYSQHGSSHGQFSPWALIQAPGPTRAFRFVYPTLASAAWNRHYVWDVRTGELEQEVVDQNLGELQAQVHYVEVTDKYVILCRSYAIHIYSRSDGRRVLEIDSRSSLRECHRISCFSLFDATPGNELSQQQLLESSHALSITIPGHRFLAGKCPTRTFCSSRSSCIPPCSTCFILRFASCRPSIWRRLAFNSRFWEHNHWTVYFGRVIAARRPLRRWQISCGLRREVHSCLGMYGLIIIRQTHPLISRITGMWYLGANIVAGAPPPPPRRNRHEPRVSQPHHIQSNSFPSPNFVIESILPANHRNSSCLHLGVGTLGPHYCRDHWC